MFHAGSIISCSGHNFDPDRFDEKMNPSIFYGITKNGTRRHTAPQGREGSDVKWWQIEIILFNKMTYKTTHRNIL